MSDRAASSDIAGRPSLLLSSEDYHRLMGLARAATHQDTVDGQRLLDELCRADIVPLHWMLKGVVTMNSYIEFRDDMRGTVQRIQLVYPEDASIGRGRISVLSPVGTALLGLAERQSIRWATDSGRRRGLTVLRVSRQPFRGNRQSD